MPAQDAQAQRRRSRRERHAVVDAERLIGVVELDDSDRLQVGQHVGQIELAGAVLVGDLGQRLDERLTLEAVQADVELLHGQLVRSGVLALDDLLERPVPIADHTPVVATRVVDRGDGRLSAGPAMRLDHPADGLGGQERRIPVDHEHIALLELLGGHLLDRVARPVRLALVDDLDLRIQMRRHLGVVGADDRFDLGRPGPGHGVDHPIDHRPSADRVEHLRSARPHPGAKAGGKDDSRKGLAQSGGKVYGRSLSAPGRVVARAAKGILLS